MTVSLFSLSCPSGPKQRISQFKIDLKEYLTKKNKIVRILFTLMMFQSRDESQKVTSQPANELSGCLSVLF